MGYNLFVNTCKRCLDYNYSLLYLVVKLWNPLYSWT